MELTGTNAEVQKIAAFEGAFDRCEPNVGSPMGPYMCTHPYRSLRRRAHNWKAFK